jgi:polysaccharide deacetylase family protein (PEP-CTERM system associated)
MNKNIMTVDVEDWFQVENLKTVIQNNWDHYELRVVNNTHRLLDLFGKHDTKATFFVLGWIAERCPALVKDIAAKGHEIASHGYMHQLVYEIDPKTFRQDIQKSKQLLEKITNTEVIGYRAPSFSITGLATDILKEEGFVYDSSFFDFKKNSRYGTLDMTSACRADGTNIYQLHNGIFEAPLSTVQYLGRTVPISGGGYFRLIPFSKYKALFQSSIKQNGTGIFYLHPWEIDNKQPRVRGLKASYRFRHYYNLSNTYNKLDRLLGDFEFTSVIDQLKLKI